MKKLLFVICSLSLFTFVLIGCAKVEKINEIVQTNFNDITKIILFNGRTGERASVEDKEKIKEFMSLIDSYEIKQIDGSPEVKPGTSYWAKFFIGDKVSFDLSFISNETDSSLGINGYEYSVIKTNFTMEKIDSFFK